MFYAYIFYTEQTIYFYLSVLYILLCICMCNYMHICVGVYVYGFVCMGVCIYVWIYIV